VPRRHNSVDLTGRGDGSGAGSDTRIPSQGEVCCYMLFFSLLLFQCTAAQQLRCCKCCPALLPPQHRSAAHRPVTFGVLLPPQHGCCRCCPTPLVAPCFRRQPASPRYSSSAVASAAPLCFPQHCSAAHLSHLLLSFDLICCLNLPSGCCRVSSGVSRARFLFSLQSVHCALKSFNTSLSSRFGIKSSMLK